MDHGLAGACDVIEVFPANRWFLVVCCSGLRGCLSHLQRRRLQTRSTIRTRRGIACRPRTCSDGTMSWDAASVRKPRHWPAVPRRQANRGLNRDGDPAVASRIRGISESGPWLRARLAASRRSLAEIPPATHGAGPKSRAARRLLRLLQGEGGRPGEEVPVIPDDLVSRLRAPYRSGK